MRRLSGARSALALSLLASAAAAATASRTAARLHHLHRRTDGAWGALDRALAHRAAVVRALAAGGVLPPGQAAALTAAADRAAAPGPGRARREGAENELGRLLARVDRAALAPGPAAELADAERRVVLARHVHTGAVRDTLAVRSSRVVRWLRLAGTAPLPAYFETVEPPETRGQ